jgi:hypothetical protein
LTFACGNYDRMAALRTGGVCIEGIDLNYVYASVGGTCSARD